MHVLRWKFMYTEIEALYTGIKALFFSNHSNSKYYLEGQVFGCYFAT